MDKTLTIESDEALRLAEQLAALTGESVPEAVTRALEEKLAREQSRAPARLLARELLEIGQRCAAQLTPPFDSSDHADLYGEDGLPE